MTLLDLSYTVNEFSQFLKSPTKLLWQGCKRISRYARGTLKHGIMFKTIVILSIEAYADVDWARSLDDIRSKSGFCVFFGGNLIQLTLRKQIVVALSSIEAKYRSLSQASIELAWIRSLLAKIKVV